MNCDKLWLKLFDTTEWLGVDAAFWIMMTLVVIIVIAMNVIFWGLPPKGKRVNSGKEI